MGKNHSLIVYATLNPRLSKHPPHLLLNFDFKMLVAGCSQIGLGSVGFFACHEILKGSVAFEGRRRRRGV